MMAYRMTPATQSTGYSPFYMMFGRDMRIPIDTALIPKDNMSKDHKQHLQKVIKNLEVARQIATENLRRHQEKYKKQHDKKAKEPKYKVLDKVMLFVPKVPVGVPPKLHSRWQGPYYVLEEGPHHTYKLADCRTNKALKTLVNAARLKIFKDPRQRTQYQDESDSNISSTSSSSSSSDESFHSQGHSSDDNSDSDMYDDSSSISGSQSRQQSQRTHKVQRAPKPDKTSIKDIIQAKRQNGITWYRVTYDNKKGTEWRQAPYVPEDLRSKFHVERTMKGRKKKPQKLKYLQQSQNQVTAKCNTSTQTQSSTSHTTQGAHTQNVTQSHQQNQVVSISKSTSHTSPNTCANTQPPQSTDTCSESDEFIPERHIGSKSCRMCNPYTYHKYSAESGTHNFVETVDITGVRIKNNEIEVNLLDEDGNHYWNHAHLSGPGILDSFVKEQFNKIKELQEARPNDRNLFKNSIFVHNVAEAMKNQKGEWVFFVHPKDVSIPSFWVQIQKVPLAPLKKFLYKIKDEFYAVGRALTIAFHLKNA
ncbi:hypothetical protein FSP39_017920 [Pinctada imbricata]|uniref:Uncharacterized protein n=1 Tax=Pinctada imbricata TaxID=66713 RepID=A0AA89BRG1_PINIB|nr:hypothetical protein FSP39_017920 [Pinctada imbricata]